MQGLRIYGFGFGVFGLSGFGVYGVFKFLGSIGSIQRLGFGGAISNQRPAP